MKKRKVEIDGHDFRTKLAELIPNYELGDDFEGQIIIYTNLKELKNGNYKEMN